MCNQSSHPCEFETITDLAKSTKREKMSMERVSTDKARSFLVCALSPRTQNRKLLSRLGHLVERCRKGTDIEWVDHQ